MIHVVGRALMQEKSMSSEPSRDTEGEIKETFRAEISLRFKTASLN
jgi:hypothetical protein